MVLHRRAQPVIGGGGLHPHDKSVEVSSLFYVGDSGKWLEGQDRSRSDCHAGYDEVDLAAAVLLGIFKR
jgi:hypothetical protein